MTFHQSCEFNTFRNNPETKFQTHTSLLTSTPDTAYTTDLKTGSYLGKKRDFLQGSCYVNAFEGARYSHEGGILYKL